MWRSITKWVISNESHLKIPWCWGRLKVRGEGDDRGWDGWMASPTRWTRVWVNSRSWWWTGRPGVLQSMGLQRVRHDWATELNNHQNPKSTGWHNRAYANDQRSHTVPTVTQSLTPVWHQVTRLSSPRVSWGPKKPHLLGHMWRLRRGGSSWWFSWRLKVSFFPLKALLTHPFTSQRLCAQCGKTAYQASTLGLSTRTKKPWRKLVMPFFFFKPNLKAEDGGRQLSTPTLPKLSCDHVMCMAHTAEGSEIKRLWW